MESPLIRLSSGSSAPKNHRTSLGGWGLFYDHHWGALSAAARETGMGLIYCFLDIEVDGPTPGENSMLSLGFAAFDEDEHEVGASTSRRWRAPEARRT